MRVCPSVGPSFGHLEMSKFRKRRLVGTVEVNRDRQRDKMSLPARARRPDLTPLSRSTPSDGTYYSLCNFISAHSFRRIFVWKSLFLMDYGPIISVLGSPQVHGAWRWFLRSIRTVHFWPTSNFSNEGKWNHIWFDTRWFGRWVMTGGKTRCPKTIHGQKYACPVVLLAFLGDEYCM